MKVLIVDDDSLVTTSLETILNHESSIEVIGTANDGYTAFELYKKFHPDIVVMDIRMEPINGIETGKLMLEYDSQVKLLYLTTFKDDEYIVEALKMGAKGYLLKTHFSGLKASLEAINNNQTVYYDEVMKKIPQLLKQTTSNESIDLLTTQEFQVMEHIANGLSNKEIAVAMFLSEGTIRNYMSSILMKLELRDRTQVAIYYYQNIKKHY